MTMIPLRSVRAGGLRRGRVGHHSFDLDRREAIATASFYGDKLQNFRFFHFTIDISKYNFLSRRVQIFNVDQGSD